MNRPRPAPALFTVPLSSAAVFLDLDGTLAAFESTPSAVVPIAERSALITRLNARLDGRLAIISGRSIADVDRIVEGCCPAVAGVHGLERRCADGSTTAVTAHPALAQVREAFTALAADKPGLLVEDKPASVALHFRNAPGEATAVNALARRLATQLGLTLQAGDMVAEVRTPGPDKGLAIEAFMAEAPFVGATPIFIGDDLTDEAGFAAVAKHGGIGILVGPARPTYAAARLEGPSQVLEWLSLSLDVGAFSLEMTQ